MPNIGSRHASQELRHLVDRLWPHDTSRMPAGIAGGITQESRDQIGSGLWTNQGWDLSAYTITRADSRIRASPVAACNNRLVQGAMNHRRTASRPVAHAEWQSNARPTCDEASTR